MSITNGNLLLLNTTNSINSSSGTLITFGGIGINNTNNSSSITKGGALTIAGGISIYKDVYIGGTIIQASTATCTISNLFINSTSGGSLTVLGGSTISNNLYVGTRIGVGNTNITPQQILELNSVTYNSNQDAGLRISTKNPISTTDNYFYLFPPAFCYRLWHLSIDMVVR